MKKTKLYAKILLLAILLVGCTEEWDMPTQQETDLVEINNERSTIPTCDTYSLNNYLTDPLIADHERSVGLIYNENNEAHCTGTLINHYGPANKTYFLTAGHCLAEELASILASINSNYNHLPTAQSAINSDLLSNQDLSELIDEANDVLIPNWKIRFGYECTSNNNVSYEFEVEGLKLLAMNFQTDMALFEITDNISTTTEKPLIRFAGWTLDNTSSQAKAVHHPEGTPKKVAISNSGFTTWSSSSQMTPHSNGFDYSNFWYVSFSTGGVTGISSGNSLINASGEIVGVLQGYGSEAYNPKNSEELFERALYSKLNKAWYWSTNSSNYNSPYRTLQPWLDSTDNHSSIGAKEFYWTPTSLALTAPGTPCQDYGGGTPGGPGGGINGNYEPTCGRFTLNWDQAYNIETIKVFRIVNTGSSQVASLSGTATTWQDDIANTWAGNDNIKYSIQFFDDNTLVKTVLSNTMQGGLIAF